jgi:hypothetical protein
MGCSLRGKCVYAAEIVKHKCNVVRVHAMKAYSASGFIAVLILNVPRDGVSSITPQTLYPWGNSCRHPLNWSLTGAVWTF